jgi:hypothetical protein
MLAEKKLSLSIILVIFVFFLGFSLFINLPAIDENFLFADQAVYFAMTQSIAYDQDLEYTRRDLIRYYESFDAGPQGIFLKRAKNKKIFYAKSWAYSLFAAPFVRVFGYNGFYVFHAVLLLIVLMLGLTYLSLANPPPRSLVYLLTFVFASVAGVYFLWISPDFFNFCLVFTIVFLWIYKYKLRDKLGSVPSGSWLSSFLNSAGSDYLAAFLVGLATFSKPPNIILMLPLVLYALFQKRFLRAVLMVLLFCLSLSLFFGTNYLLTSDWNYQGGERKSFVGNFPLERDNVTFDSVGFTMTSENYFSRFLLPPKFILFNIFYYFFGRFTGMVWYFFPAFLAFVLFFRSRRRAYDWLAFAAICGGILIYIVLMPDNYGGGGGSLANRYFLNIYPLFLFLPAGEKSRGQIFLIWAVGAIFISQILFSPFRSSAQPAMHAKKFPFKALPLEMTQVNNFPTNTNPRAYRISIWPEKPPPQREFLHFLDDNFYPRLEPNGIWTKGTGTCEMVLKTYYPLKNIVFHLLNNPRAKNEISVRVDGQINRITLRSQQKGTLNFPVGNGFQIEGSHLYHIKIRAAKGSIPYFENQASQERRYLGVFFEMELIPK